MDALEFSLRFGLVYLSKVGGKHKLRYNLCGVPVIKNIQKLMKDFNTNIFRLTIMLQIKLSKKRKQ
jgi:hypothetical protein